MTTTSEQMIYKLAKMYIDKLTNQVLKRVEEMQEDDKTHYLIYPALKVTHEEGEKVLCQYY